MQTIQTNYRGSQANYESVKKQIASRWSEKDAEKYDPHTNCMTYGQWKNFGHHVKPGESALHATVIIEKKNKAGHVVARYPKRVALFCWLQVQPMK